MRIRIFIYGDNTPIDLKFEPEYIVILEDNDPTPRSFILHSGGRVILKPRDIQSILILSDDQIKNSIRDSLMFEVYENEIRDEMSRGKEEDWR